MARITPEWLDYVKLHIRPDFTTGHLYWRIPMKGRRRNAPLGCLDSNGYIKIQIAGVACYAHQVMFFLGHGRWIDLVDHDNQKRSDNRLVNLVESNHSANALNSKVWNTNTSGVKGVSITPYGKYKVTKRGKYLGTFETLLEASYAYNQHS